MSFLKNIGLAGTLCRIPRQGARDLLARLAALHSWDLLMDVGEYYV